MEERPPSWAAPSCPLQYEILTTERLESKGTNPKEFVTLLTVDALPTADGMDLKIVTKTRLKFTKHLAYATSDGNYAALALTTDGRSWTTRQPSVLFSGMGSQGGLSWMFPSLPGEGHGPWNFLVDRRMVKMSGVRMPTSQDLGALPPDEVIQFPLRQETERAEGGTLLIRSTGPERWSSGTASTNSTQLTPVVERAGTIRAEHVLLPNGRLLRAQLEREVGLTLTAGDSSRLTQITQRSRAHLVAACDGPTEPSLAPSLSREERAIDAAGDLAAAVLEKKGPAAVGSFFSEELRRVHGERAIHDTIGRYREGSGGRPWPQPTIFWQEEDVVAAPDGVRLRLSEPVPVTPNVNVPSNFVFTMVEEDGRFVVSEIVAEFDAELFEVAGARGSRALLEISRHRLLP